MKKKIGIALAIVLANIFGVCFWTAMIAGDSEHTTYNTLIAAALTTLFFDFGALSAYLIIEK